MIEDIGEQRPNEARKGGNARRSEAVAMTRLKAITQGEEKQQQRGVYAAGSTIRINHCSFTTKSRRSRNHEGAQNQPPN